MAANHLYPRIRPCFGESAMSAGHAFAVQHDGAIMLMQQKAGCQGLMPGASDQRLWLQSLNVLQSEELPDSTACSSKALQSLGWDEPELLGGSWRRSS